MMIAPELSPAACPPLAIIVAMTTAGVIGNRGGLPWDLPADRRLFRRLTEHNTVIMGRRTYTSLPGPLPQRDNIVISRTLLHVEGVYGCRSFGEGVALGRRLGRPLFVIGGVDLYRRALPIADLLHISWIDGDFSGDRRFPDFDLCDWEELNAVDYPGFRYIAYRRATRSQAPKRESLAPAP